MRSHPLVLLVTAALSAHALAATGLPWQPQNQHGEARVEPKGVVLSLGKPGEARAVAENVPVLSGQRMSMAFAYEAAGVTSAEPFRVEIRWFDASGADVDEGRRALGFPALARIWEFHKSTKGVVHVADNISVPDRAVKATLTLAVERPASGAREVQHGQMKVRVSDFQLAKGEVKTEGLNLPDSGPADAGPLSEPPAGHAFANNLAPNGALEEGDTDVPLGWKIEGDNRNGSAEWVQGGAFSGKRALKISDRGPYVKSWEVQPGDPAVQGGKPGGNYAGAREEVSSRWVAEPVPAEPGTAYQSSAFYWYGNRHQLDQGVPNPVRIQFLDAGGKVLPAASLWTDWLPDPMAVMSFPGWIFAPGKPVVAPPNAVSMRAVVALHHAFYDSSEGTLRKMPQEMGFVLVDNISLYALPGQADRKSADLAFSQAAAAGALPYVASSAKHRPNTVSAHIATNHPGGLVIRPKADGQTAPESVALKVTNLLGDARRLQVGYKIIGIDEKPAGEGRGAVDLPPYGSGSLKVALPPGLPFGAYELRYSLQLIGEENTMADTTRFGVMPARDTSVEERGRMDYPFSLWMHMFESAIGTPQEEIMGRLADSAGMGKTWFGCGGMIFLDPQILGIADPAERKKAIDRRIAEARRAIAAWKKYGVTPMGGIQNTGLLDPSQHPVLEEAVGTFVGALKEDIKYWRYGTESMHGGVRELDRATVGSGLNVQGGVNYLFWGRKGTVRQYWQEYFLAFAAAKKADPNCLFGPQCASDTQGNVLRLFFQVGTKDQFDMFGMNTYLSAFSIWPSNIRVLADNGVPDLPLYISEFDAKTDAPLAGPDHLKKEKVASASMVAYWAAVLHRFPSFFHMEMWGMVLADESRSLTYKGLVRPQYLAYATMTNLLGAGKFVARHDLANAEIYVRERSARKGFVAVAWAKDAKATVDLEAGPDAVTVYDLWGNSREVTAQDGVVTLELTKDPVYVVAKAGIQPARTVDIQIQHATVSGESPRIRVTIANGRKEALSGQLEVLASGPLQIIDRKREIDALQPGQSEELFFDVRPAGEPTDRRINLRVRISTGEKVYESSASLNFHTAARVEAPPKIDANPEKWGPLVQVADRKDQISMTSDTKPWGGPKDLSAHADFRWDDKNLYVIFHVHDDTDMPPLAERGMWQRDIIELLVDVDRGLSAGSPLTMFSLSRFPDGPRLLRHDGTLPQGPVPGGLIAVKKVDEGVVYEAAIPWEEIQKGYAPKAGAAITLAWGVDDHDGGNSGRQAISWFSNVNEKNPAKFGDVILVGASGKTP